MPDLMPDTSIYQHISPGPLGGMSMGDLLGLVQRGRALSTQSGIAEAVRANPNDPSAAYSAAAANPDVYMGPEDVASFVHAQRARSELGQWYMGQAGQAISSLLTKKDATLDDWHPIRLMLQGYGVPPNILDQVESGVSSNGRLDRGKLATVQQWISNNAGFPTAGTIDPNTGQPMQRTFGDIIHEQAGGASKAPTQGAVPQPQGQGGIGSYPTGLPPFSATTQKEAADAQASIQHARSVDIPQQRMLLSNMLDLSREAATGPGANWQVNWSKLMTNIGMPQFANMTPDQVASSENFKKIAERLVNQMATTGGHVTNDFLHNAYGSNPGLEISRQGREGMITWLQGIIDAQNLVGKNWQTWLGQHPGREGHFYDWASGRVPGGMNMSNLDMRVFQFERMNPEEQDKFLSSMTRKGERELFLTHHRDYDKAGWLDSAKE